MCRLGAWSGNRPRDCVSCRAFAGPGQGTGGMSVYCGHEDEATALSPPVTEARSCSHVCRDMRIRTTLLRQDTSRVLEHNQDRIAGYPSAIRQDRIRMIQ